uniref:Uncharacterized protein n=1 Tax=viral metagenome TaxID=1070528 RepID=A0A6C0AQJ8_9ZZZZ
MDINYFLLCKNRYDKIIHSLDNIIENLDDINFLTDKFVSDEIINTHVIFSKPINNDIFLQQKLYVQYLKCECLKQIYLLCEHEFIDDTIDIDPDRSTSIRYCKYCESSENLK